MAPEALLICHHYSQYIERWYDIPSGAIYLDGVNIRDLRLSWLRTHVRLVQQEPVLFSGTVQENVAFGLFGTDKANLSNTEQRALVEEACREAYASEFIERLPMVSLLAVAWETIAKNVISQSCCAR